MTEVFDLDAKEYWTNAKGYWWNKRDKKYQAQIKLDGKYIYVGGYDTEEDAHSAYLKAKEQYHIID